MALAADGQGPTEKGQQRLAHDTVEALDVFLELVAERQAQERARAAGANMGGEEGGG